MPFSPSGFPQGGVGGKGAADPSKLQFTILDSKSFCDSVLMARIKGQGCTIFLLVFLLLQILRAYIFVAPGEDKPLSIRFEDVTDKAGIRFQHFNAASSKKYIIETMGSGCAWIDFDGDGLLDAFFVNGGTTPEVRPSVAQRHALFRNMGN